MFTVAYTVNDNNVILCKFQYHIVSARILTLNFNNRVRILVEKIPPKHVSKVDCVNLMRYCDLARNRNY